MGPRMSDDEIAVLDRLRRWQREGKGLTDAEALLMKITATVAQYRSEFYKITPHVEQKERNHRARMLEDIAADLERVTAAPDKPQPPAPDARLVEAEEFFLSQARVCNLQDENMTMKGQEENARYWEGRSDAFQDAVAKIRSLASPAPKSEEKQ